MYNYGLERDILILTLIEAMNLEPKKIYTVEETASLIKKSERQIRRYLASGKLKSVKIPGTNVHQILGEWIKNFYISK